MANALPYRGQYPRTYVHEGRFPAGFIWGVGTAAYQIEGGYNEGGRGASIWDMFSGAGGGKPNPGMVVKATGDLACDHYHRWKDDVALMARLGLKNYRFSISWPRLLPNGTLAGGINEEGVAFYSRLIDELVAHDIEPYVTLYHWDLPLALQTASLPGWLDPALEGFFADYAELCFSRFGGRVKRWTTFNEAWTFVVLGYGTGSKAPGVPFTNLATHPYLAGHTVLLAHAEAVRRFRARGEEGQIGITNNCDWREPLTSEPADIAAAERAVEWWLGWFADPIWRGDYPEAMRAALGKRLPRFTSAQKAALTGSADFFGLNHYGSAFAVDQPNPAGYGTAGGSTPSYWADFAAREVHDFAEYAGLAGEMPRAASSWLYSAPWGLRKLLSWVARRYDNPPLYVTENGWSTPGDEDVATAVHDPGRLYFYANYTSEMRRAIYEDGVDVRGYFAWSLMDNFEWEMGYSERFGLVFTDFETQQRTPKASAKWFSELAATNALPSPERFLGDARSRAGAAEQAAAEKAAAEKAAQQLGLKPEAIVAIVLGALLCACGLCVGVLVLGRRLSRAERAITEYKVERSALMARDADVGETDGHGAELTEPVPRPPRGKALPLELSVVAITKATDEPERP